MPGAGQTGRKAKGLSGTPVCVRLTVMGGPRAGRSMGGRKGGRKSAFLQTLVCGHLCQMLGVGDGDKDNEPYRGCLGHQASCHLENPSGLADHLDLAKRSHISFNVMPW